jgi:hypothetical protein
MNDDLKKNNHGMSKQSCLLSKEVLLFLEWLLLYDSKILDNFIKKIWTRGFDKVCSENYQDNTMLESIDAQQTIFDFFTYLEFAIDKLEKKNNVGRQNRIDHSSHFSDVTIESEVDNYDDERTLMAGCNISALEANQLLTMKDDPVEIKKKLYKKFLNKWNTANTLVE